MVLIAVLLRIGTLAWIRRKFKPASPIQKKVPLFYSHRHLDEDAEQKRQEKEQASRSFLQQHLGTIRSWRKPETRQDPETGFKSVVPTLSVPAPVAQPGTFAKAYGRLFAKKAGTLYDFEMQSQKSSVAAERRIQALKAKYNKRAVAATESSASSSYPKRDSK
jgi:hypothetical protein